MPNPTLTILPPGTIPSPGSNTSVPVLDYVGGDVEHMTPPPPGGFPSFTFKGPGGASELAKGGAGSLIATKEEAPSKPAGAAAGPTPGPTPSSMGSGVMAAAAPPSVASVINNDVEEVTLNSSYYPVEQPFLARIILDFPKKLDEETVTSSSGVPSIPVGETKPLSDVAVPTGTAINTTFSTNSVPIFGLSGDTENYLEIRPNNFLSLDYQRIIDGVGRFTLTLFDPQWDRIEKKLVKNKGFFKFKYGYSDGDPKMMSPWYLARAFSYKLDFSMEGVTIVITGKTIGYKIALTKTYSSLGGKGERISDIVKEIVTDLGEGYVPIIEPTRSIMSREGLDTTDGINKIVTLSGQSHFSVIINDLVSNAVNEEGQGDYHFFIHINAKGDKEFHFHTKFYAYAPNEKVKVPAFTQFRSKNTALIRFTPNWSMTLAQIAGGGGLLSANVDMESKDYMCTNLNMINNIQTMDNKGQAITLVPKEYLPKKFDTIEYLKAFDIFTTPERNKEQNKTVTQAKHSTLFPGAVTGTIEIFGTPAFTLLQKIAVVVFKPQGDNTIASSDNVHWISGFFRIIKIHESIKAGKYITTFGLVSDYRSSVAPDQIKFIASK
jgi:hypothetical protein